MNETGATLALIGRGEPGGGDGEIDRTLERFREEVSRDTYCSCDIVDPDAPSRTIRKIEGEVGTITGVIHGASIPRPSRTDNLSVDGVLQEVSPKILGAWNLCRAAGARAQAVRLHLLARRRPRHALERGVRLCERNDGARSAGEGGS